MLKIPAKLFWWSNKIIFIADLYLVKFLDSSVKLLFQCRDISVRKRICTTVEAFLWRNSIDAPRNQRHPSPLTISFYICLSSALPFPLSFSFVSRLFFSVLIRSHFAIYHRSINLCRDSISTPAHPSLASTTVDSVLRLPLGWILSQTQSGAPLRAKSEDMIARECLVFYKIGYPSWEILRERQREREREREND